MIQPTKLSATAAAFPSSVATELAADLLAAATADFRANLRHSRALSLLVDYYLKQGLTSEQIRQAVRNASTAPARPIHLVFPVQAAA